MASIASTELWRLKNSKDAARCVAATHPRGVELRYEINAHPLISKVLESWSDVDSQSRIWREGLESRGWVAAPARKMRLRRH